MSAKEGSLPLEEGTPDPAPDKVALDKARRHPLYRFVRHGLLAASLFLLSGALANASRFLDSYTEEVIITPPEDDRAFGDMLVTEAFTMFLTQDADAVIMEALAREDIGHADAYYNMAVWVNQLEPGVMTLQLETIAAYERAHEWWAIAIRQGKRCVQGALTGEITTTAHFACVVATDLTVLGDARDLTLHGGAALLGGTYDEVLLTLSVIGIALFIVDMMDKGTSLQELQTGKAIMKSVVRLGKYGAGVSADLRRLAHQSVRLDEAWAWVKAGMPGGRKVAASFVRRDGFDVLKRATDDLGTIYHATGGGSAGIHAVNAVLKQADAVDDLGFYSRTARVMGKQTDEVLTVLGKNIKRAFKVTRTIKRGLGVMGLWTAWVVTAVFGLVAGLSDRVFRQVGDKLLLRWLQYRIATANT